VLALVAVGVLRGVPLLVAVALVAVAVPTSRELSRRLLVVGCLVLGWAPLLWWWDLPTGSLGRVAVLLAVVVGLLAAWLTPRPGVRARQLVPRVRWTDAAAGVGVLATVWAYLPTLRVSRPEGALSGFFRAWDNAAHFDMAEMIRAHGTLVGRVAQGPLGEWSYANYPQGFHAATAAVMEALAGPTVDEPGAELLTYTHAMTLVVMLALATVVAGICSLPAMRRRPLVALPAVLFVVATFALGPGGMAIHDGFPNFFVACTLLACVPLLVTQMTRPTSPPLLAALGGAVVGVAHNWSFLLTMGVVGAVVLLFPLRRSRWPVRARDWTVAGLIAVATLFGLLVAWSALRNQPGITDVLTLDGPVNSVPVNQLVLTVGLALAACAALVSGVRRTRGPFGDDATRAGWVGLLPLAGVVVAVLVARLQTERVGAPGYYFWKYAIGLQLLSAVALVAALPLLVPARVRRGVVARIGVVVSSVLVATVAFQAYGLPKTLPIPLGTGLAPGGAARADLVAITRASLPDAESVLAAARAHDGGPEVPHVFLPFPSEPFYPAPGSTPPALLQQWFNSLTGRWTEPNNSLIDPEVPPDQSVDEAVRAARRVLEKDPDAVVVVGPTFVDAVRDAVAGDGWSERVQTW
jgi:hypothetical protein